MRLYQAPIETQQEQFRKSVVNKITYERLCLCVNRLCIAKFITLSQANKYKSWYRRMKRGDM